MNYQIQQIAKSRFQPKIRTAIIDYGTLLVANIVKNYLRRVTTIFVFMNLIASFHDSKYLGNKPQSCRESVEGVIQCPYAKYNEGAGNWRKR